MCVWGARLGRGKKEKAHTVVQESCKDSKGADNEADNRQIIRQTIRQTKESSFELTSATDGRFQGIMFSDFEG